MYSFECLRLTIVFRQKKIKTNQGYWLCCKKFFNSILLLSSPSVATQRKVICPILKTMPSHSKPFSTNIISSTIAIVTGNEVVKAEHFLETLIKGLFCNHFSMYYRPQPDFTSVYYVCFSS